MRQPVCLIVSLSLRPLPPPRLPGPLSQCLFVSRPPPPLSIFPYSIPSGHAEPGPESRNLACGGRVWFRCGGPAETKGLPDCFRANHRRLSGSPGPLMTLRAGPRGTGELSRKWGSSEASQPSQSPFREGGCRGAECCPFFCSICRPQSGRVGNETMAFFHQKRSMSDKNAKSGV